MQAATGVVSRVIATQVRRTPQARPSTKLTSDLEAYFGFRTFGEETLEKMLVQTQQFCLAMKNGAAPYSLAFLGTSGAGKSHLAHQIDNYFQLHARWYQIEGKSGLAANLVRDGGFFSWRKIAQRLLDRDYSAVKEASECWFAVLDDIGCVRDPSGFLANALDQIVDARQKKWTVYTANMTLHQVKENIDARVASRLLRNGSRVVEVDTLDFAMRGCE